MIAPNRLILANDLPGLGKVALSASLPLLAACQVEAAILPTVILSSHSGGFPSVYVEEFGDGLGYFLQQWQEIGLTAQGLVTGYIKSPETLKKLADFAIGQDIPLIVDPIMGDHGKLYTGFDTAHILAMREFISTAWLILPNLTEAALLTQSDFLEEYGPADILTLIEELARLTVGDIVLTGVSFETDQVGVAYFNRAEQQVSYYMSRKFPQHFFGTGDMLTTLIAAAFAEGIALNKALPAILTFLDRSLATTLELKRDMRYGVYFEPHIPYLAQLFQTLKNEKGESYEK